MTGTQEGRRWIRAAATLPVVALGVALVADDGLRELLVEGCRRLFDRDLDGVRRIGESLGPWAAAYTTLLMIAQALAAPIPAFVVTAANSLLFGPLVGAALSVASATLAAVICFGLARAWGEPLVARYVAPRTRARMDELAAEHGATAVLVARLVPFVPFDPVSYLAGLTPMRLGPFVRATLVGQIPAAIGYSYLAQGMAQPRHFLAMAVAVVGGLALLGVAVHRLTGPTAGHARVLWGVALAGGAAFLIAGELGLMRRPWITTAPLDSAPAAFVVPDYFDEVFFQGQGFPVHSTHVREGRYSIGDAELFVLPYAVDGLDYKNIQETPEQVARVNAELGPDPPWRTDESRRMGHYKCLSVSASLIADWFTLAGGGELGEYVSVLDGRRYRGMDPKALDSLYYERARTEPDVFVLTDEDHLDPISGVRVPYGAVGFARILGEESARPGPRSVRDVQLDREYAYDFTSVGPLRPLRIEGGGLDVRAAASRYPREASERVRAALAEHGPLLAGIRVRFAALHGVFDARRIGDVPLVGVTGHGVVIVGWIERKDRLYFLYRETFGRSDVETAASGPSWRIYPVYGFNEIHAFRRG